MERSSPPHRTLLARVALSLFLGCAAAAEPQSAARLAKAPAVALAPIQSPLGFSIEVPAGWVLKPVQEAPNVLVFSAPGAAAPSIFVVPALLSSSS